MRHFIPENHPIAKHNITPLAATPPRRALAAI